MGRVTSFLVYGEINEAPRSLQCYYGKRSHNGFDLRNHSRSSIRCENTDSQGQILNTVGDIFGVGGFGNQFQIMDASADGDA